MKYLPPSLRRVFAISSLLILGGVIIFALYLIYRYETIFDVVIPGQVFRSHQLSNEELAQVITHDHIQSVINLRGANPGKSWYDDEIALSNATGIKHFDIPLSARKMPPATTLKQLTLTLRNAPRPVLIHCLNGVDRSGFAVIIILLLNNEHDLQKLADQVSYHHFVIHSDSIGKQFLKQYSQWLKQQRLEAGRDSLARYLEVEKSAP